MSEFFRTAIYTKNISNTERILRLMMATGVAVPAALYLSEPWTRWTALGGAVTTRSPCRPTLRYQDLMLVSDDDAPCTRKSR
jgi:hypothetical protein